MKKQEFYIGVDVGGTTYKCGVVDANNNIVYKKNIPSNSEVSADETLNEISFLIDDALNNYPSAKSIGMGVPGIVSDEGILKIAPNFPNWNNVDFGIFFRKKYSLPFTVDNDANAAAMAELLAGSGINYKNFIYITLGTGVGGAIIIDKKIFKGTNGGAGEIGHFIIDLNHFDADLPKYRNGTIEELIGRQAIINNAKLQAKKYENSLLNSKNFFDGKDFFDVYDISKAANLGDEAAIKCLSQVGFYFGIAIASFANIFDIPNFIIGGGISQSDFILDTATKIAKERALPTVAKHLKIERAKYLNETGIIGAALLGKSVI
jgi:glucokinase